MSCKLLCGFQTTVPIVLFSGGSLRVHDVSVFHVVEEGCLHNCCEHCVLFAAATDGHCKQHSCCTREGGSSEDVFFQATLRLSCFRHDFYHLFEYPPVTDHLCFRRCARVHECTFSFSFIQALQFSSLGFVL